MSVERVQLHGSLRTLGPCVFHPRTVLREGVLHDLDIIILTQTTRTYPILDHLLALKALAEWLEVKCLHIAIWLQVALTKSLSPSLVGPAGYLYLYGVLLGYCYPIGVLLLGGALDRNA